MVLQTYIIDLIIINALEDIVYSAALQLRQFQKA